MDPRSLRRLTIALVVGAMAPLLDATIVSVALHSLATDLHASLATIQWVSTAYLLALGATIPVVGWLQRRFGGKRVWIAALVVFLVGSILCSVAWDPASLIAFRVVQGVGGGAMIPLLTTLLMQAAHGQSIGRLMSAVSLPTALGPILGPVIGGLLLSAGDWRWLFWVNVPFVAVGLVLAVSMIPGDRPVGTRAPLDLVGLLLLSPAMFGLLLGLSDVTEAGGFARGDVWAPMLAGGVLLIAFVAWALHRRERALVDLRPLRHRPLAASTGLLFLIGAFLYGAMLLLPLYFQLERGTDALGAGLLLIPQGVGSLLTRTVAGRLTDRFGGRLVAMAGFVVVALATVPFALADARTSEPLLLAALLLRGAGLGAVFIPVMAVGFTGLTKEETPHASIVTRIAQQVGGAAGVAVLAVLLQSVAASVGPVAAFQQAFWWSIGFTAAGAVLCLLLPGRPAASPEAAVAQQPTPAAA